MTLLKSWMDARQMTVRDLSERLGLSQEYTRLIVKGHKYPGLSTAYAIENATGGEIKATDLVRKYEPKPKCPHCGRAM